MVTLIRRTRKDARGFAMPPTALFDSWSLFPASVDVSAIHVRSSIKPLPLQDENWAKVNTTPKLQVHGAIG